MANTTSPYPLKFHPVFKERIWGGRELAKYGLTLPEGKIGEGWMIGDHPNGTTKVANGALAGRGLDNIRELFGSEWLGDRGTNTRTGRFPLLIKLLDCNDDLSVQVHPDDHYPRLSAGELGKTEMWVVLDAKPGAKIIYGLAEEVDRTRFESLIAEDRIMEGLKEVEVSAGDVFYIPAGTVHALCAGVLVAEIQQNSDTTYRLYDYKRLGLDGQLRELHIEDSLNIIHYDNAGARRSHPEITSPNRWISLVHSEYFSTDKAELNGTWGQSAVPDSFTILIVCDGQGEITWTERGDDYSEAFSAGQCFLIPANMSRYTLSGQSVLLRTYMSMSE